MRWMVAIRWCRRATISSDILQFVSIKYCSVLKLFNIQDGISCHPEGTQMVAKTRSSLQWLAKACLDGARPHSQFIPLYFMINWPMRFRSCVIWPNRQPINIRMMVLPSSTCVILSLTAFNYCVAEHHGSDQSSMPSVWSWPQGTSTISSLVT